MGQEDNEFVLLGEQDHTLDESCRRGSENVEKNVTVELEDCVQNDDDGGDSATLNKNIYSMKAPYVGMCFDSYEEAKEYYIEYGRQNGFSVRVRSVNKTRARVDDVTSAYLVCSREGKKEKKDGIDGVDEIRRSCNTIKCGCKAKIRILLHEELNKWMVTMFSDDHNHKFVTPSKRMRLRTNRHMPDAAKDLTEAFSRENLQIGKVPAIFGGAEKGFDKRDCYNHLRNVRHKNLEVGDAQTVINYFQMRDAENPQFFYAVQVDENGRAVNFFWVDARSRMAYEQFGNFVTFDTTYRTNKYEMPFAPFTGVNHHYQTIQFGCALLQDETEPTFLWLFNTWLEAMGGRHPSSIITDQDFAMGAAIKKVFPNTPHRLCIWHIKKKFGEKLSHIYYTKSKFKSKMKKCIYGTYKVQDFEEMWNAIILEFNLCGNDWLRHLYEIRESWVPVYHRGTFYAGMNTTGRSEGVNAFFNEFVTPKTNLTDFVVRYEQALKKIIDRESHEDYVSEHKNRIIDGNNLLLKHGAKIYTRNMFEKFCEQLVDSIRFKCEQGERSGDFNTHVVTAKIGYPEQFHLKMKPGTYEGYCDCKNFEFVGLPCRHVLKTLNKLDVDEIPPHFILEKWMKGANFFRVMDEKRVSDTYECSEAFKLSHLCRISTQMSCVASKSNKLYKMVIEGINELFARIMEENKKIGESDGTVQENSTLQENVGAEKSCQLLVQDPHITQRKGRPKEDKGKGKANSTGRIMSSIEASSSQKKRKCSTCQRTGHNKRNCPQKPNIEQLKLREPCLSGEDTISLGMSE